MVKLQYLNYKEPLTPVEEGHGYLGTLAQTENKDLVQCHKCGELVENLGQHAWLKHQMKARDYRVTYKLGLRTPLCSDNYSEKQKAIKLKQRASMSEEEREAKREAMREVQRQANRVGNPRSLEALNKDGMCPDQLIEKIHLLAEKLGKSPTHEEFRQEYDGKYIGAINRTFGSWNGAKHMAGFKPNKSGSKVPHNRSPYTNEQLLEFLRSAYKEKGSLPTFSDWRKGFLPSYNLYRHRFGGIQKARSLAFGDKPLSTNS